MIGPDGAVEVSQYGFHGGWGAVGHTEWLIFSHSVSLISKGSRHGSVPTDIAPIGGLSRWEAHLSARSGMSHADVTVLTERVLRLKKWQMGWKVNRLTLEVVAFSFKAILFEIKKSLSPLGFIECWWYCQLLETAAASSLSLASAFPYVCMSLGRAWVFGFGLPTSSLSSSTLYFRDCVLLANLADVARY